MSASTGYLVVVLISKANPWNIGAKSGCIGCVLWSKHLWHCQCV